MKKALFAALILVIVLSSAGCSYAASTPAVPVTQPTAEEPFPQITPDLKGIVSATQTAAALNPQGAKPAAGQPAQPVQPTAKPAKPKATKAPEQPQPAQPTEAQPVEAQPSEPPAEPETAEKVIPSPTPGRPASYTIKAGEHAYCIARRFNVSPGELMALNGLGAQTLLSPGAVLRIPTGGAWTQGPRALIPHPAKYTVVGGDTIYKIACKFGDASPDLIAFANDLKAPYTLSAGQVLQIP